MATKRIKDISTTATTFAADDFIALDASSVGTRKMAKASLITQVGANYLEKADNLSDVASKDTSKLNLEVPNVGTAANEVSVNGMLGDLAFQSSAGVVVDDLTVDGQLTAAVGKPMPVNGPSMRFDGSNDYVSFADNDSFSFVDGSGNDTPFSISAWVKMENVAGFSLVSKYGSSAAVREWAFEVNSGSDLYFILRDTSGNIADAASVTDMSAYAGKWVHVSATFSAESAAASAQNDIKLYVNAAAIPVAATGGSYLGMSNTSQPVQIGRKNIAYANGEIRDVKLFNKELSAAEVKEVYSNGQLPNSFSESTGGADGGIYTQDATPSGEWSGSAGTEADEAGPIGGRSNILKFTNDGTLGQHLVENTSIGTPVGKRYRVEFYYYIPSTNSNIDGLDVNDRVTLGKVGTVASATLDAWTKFSGEYVATNNQLGINALDGGVSSYQDAGADDVFYIDGLTVTQLGSVLDARAEQFDSSTGKLYDLSGNGFVGTQSGGVSLLGREFIIQEKGIFTPTIYYQNPTGLSTSYTTQSGNYVRTGDLVAIQIKLTWTVTGTPVNDNLGVRGIPFQPAREDSLACHDSQGQTALVTSNSVNDILICLNSSLASNQADNVGTGTHTLYISGTYQIQ